MKNYLVVVTGCTDPSCEAVGDEYDALTRYCEDVKSRELKAGQDCAFLAQVDEDGVLSVCSFTAAEVEERTRELGREA